MLLLELTMRDISEVRARLFSSLLADIFLYCRLELSSRSEKARLNFFRELVLDGPSNVSDLLCFFRPVRLEGRALRFPKTAERTAAVWTSFVLTKWSMMFSSMWRPNGLAAQGVSPPPAEWESEPEAERLRMDQM